jgi:hypothetical protein
MVETIGFSKARKRLARTREAGGENIPESGDLQVECGVRQLCAFVGFFSGEE